MKRGLRFAVYGILLLVGLGLLGWLRAEQRRAEEPSYEVFTFNEPDWARWLPALRQTAAQHSSEADRLNVLANLLTAPYREQDAPLRFRVMTEPDGRLVLRLNAGMLVPRWYTARAAQTAYREARHLLGRETPVYIYETYIVGKPRLIGVCRERNGVVEVALR